MRQILTRAAPVALLCDPAMEEHDGDSAAPIATIAYTASRFSPSLARCSGLYNTERTPYGGIKRRVLQWQPHTKERSRS